MSALHLQRIRARSFGLHWCSHRAAFLRLDASGPPWRVDVFPPATIPDKPLRGWTRKYTAWWDDAALITAMPALTAPLQPPVDAPTAFYFDDAGGAARARFGVRGLEGLNEQ